MQEDDILPTLLDAIKRAPDSAALRKHYGDLLFSRRMWTEAEAAYKDALHLSPQSVSTKVALARAFYPLGKRREAIVILESLPQGEMPGAARVLYARLLKQEGMKERAVEEYVAGVQQDPTAADSDLANSLGLLQPVSKDADQQQGQSEAASPIMPVSESEVETPALTFEDVGGMQQVKEEINMKILYPVKHAELFASYGKKLGGGILMYGPPGCGKTYLARATAGEMKAGFIAVGLDDVLDMYVGQSEKRLHDIFQRARRNKPCVLFFDEVDGLGANRTDLRNNPVRMQVNQFLAEFDGVHSSNEGILILAATNAPWHLDPAFRRPGRFDRILFVPPPDQAARASIIRLGLRSRPAADVDCEAIAASTRGFSGADLAAVIDIAVEVKLQEAMKVGRATPITTSDLLAAAGRRRPSTAEWFETARNYATYANQAGVYDDIAKYQGGR